MAYRSNHARLNYGVAFQLETRRHWGDDEPLVLGGAFVDAGAPDRAAARPRVVVVEFLKRALLARPSPSATHELYQRSFTPLLLARRPFLLALGLRALAQPAV